MSILSIFQSLCLINDSIVEALEIYFIQCYPTIHHFHPNKLVNLAKLFAQLLSSDSISWQIFSTVRLTESETTYSSRAYLKNIFKDLIVYMGRDSLKERILDP
jgi:pre-mRNA-splicing factor CWC22